MVASAQHTMNQGSDFWLTPAPVSGQTVNATISNWLLLSYDVFRLTSDGVWRMIYDRESISLHSGQLSGLSQQKSKNPGVFFLSLVHVHWNHLHTWTLKQIHTLNPNSTVIIEKIHWEVCTTHQLVPIEPILY